jgi:hypothetical protein
LLAFLSSSAILLLLAFLVTASSATTVTTTPFCEQNKRIRAADVLLLSGILFSADLSCAVSLIVSVPFELTLGSLFIEDISFM